MKRKTLSNEETYCAFSGFEVYSVLDYYAVKILFIDGAAGGGGAQVTFCDLILAFKDNPDLSISVALPVGIGFKRLQAAGIPVFPIDPIREAVSFSFLSRLERIFQRSSKLARIIFSLKPDVIHANAIPAFSLARRFSGNTPLIWHVRGMYVDPVVLQTAYERASCTLVSSPALGRKLYREVRLENHGCLETIPLGMIFPPEHTRSAARERLGIPEDRFVVGIVADFIQEKRYDIFIHEVEGLLKERPETIVLAIGRTTEEPAYYRRLRKITENLPITWVTDTENAAELIPAMDVMFQTSMAEPTARAVAEAMYLGVPVIARDSAGPSDLIEDRKTGFLVARRVGGDFAKITMELMNDPELRGEIIAAAKKSIQKKCNLSEPAAAMVKLYKRLKISEDSTIRRHRFDDQDD